MVPNLGCRGAESPGCFDVLPKHSARDVMHERVRCDEAASLQLPIAAAIFVVLHLSPAKNIEVVPLINLWPGGLYS